MSALAAVNPQPAPEPEIDYAGPVSRASEELMKHICGAADRDECRPELLGELLNAVLIWKQHGRELQDALDEELLEWCCEHGDLDLTTARFYAGPQAKTRRLLKGPEAMDILFEAVGGDTEAFAQLLSTNAFKQGAAKTIAGDEAWSKVWSKEPILDEEGNPIQELKKARVL